MTIPNEYKVDHLFLLIGENPLPNYLAAKLLLETQSRFRNPGEALHGN